MINNITFVKSFLYAHLISNMLICDQESRLTMLSLEVLMFNLYCRVNDFTPNFTLRYVENNGPVKLYAVPITLNHFTHRKIENLSAL